MKLNKILMALSAMAIVGCSSEDFDNPSVAQAIDDSRLIQLDENFVLAGVGEVDNTTRTHWEQDATTKALRNKFLPILTEDAAVDAVLATKVDKFDQSVGLCWLGEAGGEKVYTNYQFYHFGWLKKDETKATVECNELTNGAWYDEIKFATTAATDVTGNEPATASFAWNGGVTKDFAITDLNYNSGVYKTDNKAIFGGEYIVYYPFNKDFKDVGTIPAKAQTSFSPVPTELTDPDLGDATFRYSAPIEIKGGDQAGGFGLYNLSALVQLKVKGVSGGKIDQIVLWSKKEQLLEQANLAADKIAAGKKGTELYAETKGTKGTKTIVATFATADQKEVASGTDLDAYITALPTKVEDLVAFVHRVDGKWAKITIGSKEFKPNSGQLVTINVKAADFKAEYIAVDEATLIAALKEARLVATAANPVAIEVIGDITLEAKTADGETVQPAKTFNINKAADANITIKGDAIIVPEDVTLNLNTKMESDVRVLGKSCCSGAMGGRLRIIGGTVNNVTMEKAEATVTEANYDTYNPRTTFVNAGPASATVAAGKTFDVQAGNVDVNKAVAHKGNINIAEGVKVTVSETGDLNFMGSTVVNDGTIEVKKAGKFDMTDASGNATAADGKRMTNNGTFIHNVDAAVGTAVQSMNQNGEYRCRVDKQIKLDDAYQKWLACSVIEIVGGPQYYNLGVAEKNIEYKHNGKYIDIEVNGSGLTTFANPADAEGNGDEKDIQVGKLTVMSGKLYVPFATGEGKRKLTVNGDMTVSATSSLFSSKKITVKGNLIVNNGAELKYSGLKKNEGGLEVEKDIKVSGSGTKFNASIDNVDALDITCKNFTLADHATAEFGNRTNGDTKNLTVSETITNPNGCTFDIKAANLVGGSVQATITCKKLIVGGSFPNGTPQVVE